MNEGNRGGAMCFIRYDSFCQEQQQLWYKQHLQNLQKLRQEKAKQNKKDSDASVPPQTSTSLARPPPPPSDPPKSTPPPPPPKEEPPVPPPPPVEVRVRIPKRPTFKVC